MRALVVDDSRAMRMILRQLLKDAGFDVAEAGGGREGLERLRQLGTADVILVDWHMPEMDGLEFVRAVRAADGGGVRLIMVTAEDDPAQEAAARAAGADDFLLKPPGKDALLEILRRLAVAPA
jgi:two-component system, chemotaxis family, chemotaxis protein CheY